MAWTDTRSWCYPRQEAALDTRIAATGRLRPTGGRAAPAKSGNPGRAGGARPGRPERPRTPAGRAGWPTSGGNPAKHSHNRASQRLTDGMEWPAIASGPASAGQLVKRTARPINMPCGGPEMPNCRTAATAAGWPARMITLPAFPLQASGRRAAPGGRPSAGPLAAARQAHDLPGRASAAHPAVTLPKYLSFTERVVRITFRSPLAVCHRRVAARAVLSRDNLDPAGTPSPAT